MTPEQDQSQKSFLAKRFPVWDATPVGLPGRAMSTGTEAPRGGPTNQQTGKYCPKCDTFAGVRKVFLACLVCVQLRVMSRVRDRAARQCGLDSVLAGRMPVRVPLHIAAPRVYLRALECQEQRMCGLLCVH
jgi:hypothetical protein